MATPISRDDRRAVSCSGLRPSQLTAPKTYTTRWDITWRPGAKAPACLSFAALDGPLEPPPCLSSPCGRLQRRTLCGSRAPALRAGPLESQPALTRATFVAVTLSENRRFPLCRYAAVRGPRGFFRRGSLSRGPARTAGAGASPPGS